MFPGCMSAWKKPSRNTWVKKISTPVRASFGMSTPCRRSSSTWLTGVPCILCMVMTVLVQKSQYTSGTARSGESRKLRRSWLACAASRMRSSSSDKCRANSATTSRGLMRLPSAQKRSTRPAAESMSARSFAITGSIPGRRILTAASVPPGRTAKCTWATDALAVGRGSNFSNTSPMGLPKACSTSATASSAGNGGTWSCSFASSSARSAGSRSRRVESTWPNLTKMGPSASSARRRRTPRGRASERKKKSAFVARASRLPAASANSSSPKRRATQKILARRNKAEGKDAGRSGQFTRIALSDRNARRSTFSVGPMALDALLQPRRIVAQSFHFAAEILDIGRAREQRLLLGPVFREVYREAQRRFALPGGESPAFGNQAMREHVADQSGEIFLDVPGEIAEQDLDRARKLGRSFDLDLFQRALVTREQQRQRAGLELDLERAGCALGRPLEPPCFENLQTQIGKGQAAELDTLAREPRQALGRPGLLEEQMVQPGNGAAFDHTLRPLLRIYSRGAGPPRRPSG